MSNKAPQATALPLHGQWAAEHVLSPCLASEGPLPSGHPPMSLRVRNHKAVSKTSSNMGPRLTVRSGYDDLSS